MKNLNLAWTIVQSMINDHGVGEVISQDFMESLKIINQCLEDELISFHEETN